MEKRDNIIKDLNSRIAELTSPAISNKYAHVSIKYEDIQNESDFRSLKNKCLELFNINNDLKRENTLLKKRDSGKPTELDDTELPKKEAQL